MKITSLPEGERPREKLFAHGPESLSVVELLAVLLRTGVEGQDVIEFSASLLNGWGGLEGLCRMTPAELKSVKGIKDAKAATLSAVMELGKRIAMLNSRDRESWNEKLRSLARDTRFSERENIFVLFLDGRERVIDEEKISYGGQDGAFLDIPVFFRKAVRLGSRSIVMMHNHPNGVLRASDDDVSLTEHIRSGLKILGIRFKGHYVAADGELTQVP